MKNNKITVGAAALVALIATAGIAASTFAYQGDPTIQGPNIDSATHEAMTKAFEDRDYEAWKENKPNEARGRMMDVVNNEEAFTKFAEMREARLDGDTEKADTLRAELGLGQGNGAGHGHGMRDHGSRGEHRGEREQNHNDNFVDANSNGTCDLME